MTDDNKMAPQNRPNRQPSHSNDLKHSRITASKSSLMYVLFTFLQQVLIMVNGSDSEEENKSRKFKGSRYSLSCERTIQQLYLTRISKTPMFLWITKPMTSCIKNPH